MQNDCPHRLEAKAATFSAWIRRFESGWGYVRKWLSVFLAVTVADMTWVLYIRWVATGQHIAAALVSVAIVLLGAFVTISYVNDRKMLVPAGLGAFVGTLLSSWWLQ